MKRSFLLLLILVLALCVSTCLVSCNTDTDAPAGDQNTPDDGNGDTDAPAGDDTGDGIDWNNTGLTGIPMIYNSKARFQIVYTAEGGSSAIKAANDLVAQLRELGVDIGDAVSDKNADDVKEYEIIIGSGARHRGDEINITQRELGEDGEIIQLFQRFLVKRILYCLYFIFANLTAENGGAYKTEHYLLCRHCYHSSLHYYL